VKSLSNADNADGVVGGLVYPNQEVAAPQPREMPSASVIGEDYNWQGTVLDNQDPFEAALSDMLHIYRHRRPSMMIDGDIFATFTRSALSLDLPQFGTPEAILHLLQREQANINAMRRSGSLFDPNNPEAIGSYVETAFYANLLYAWIKRYVSAGFRRT
jgi:hypothetical protein